MSVAFTFALFSPAKKEQTTLELCNAFGRGQYGLGKLTDLCGVMVVSGYRSGRKE